MTKAETLAVKAYIETLVIKHPATNRYENDTETLDWQWRVKLANFLNELIER